MEKGWWKSGTVKQCGGTIDQWNSVAQCGTVWWNSVEQYGGQVEQCGGTVSNGMVEQWNGVVEQWNSIVEQ